jgi:hypothetical protein
MLTISRSSFVSLFGVSLAFYFLYRLHTFTYCKSSSSNSLRRVAALVTTNALCALTCGLPEGYISGILTLLLYGTTTRLHPVRASSKANTAEPNSLPLIDCSQARTDRASCKKYRPHKIERGPLVNQRMRSLSFSDTRLNGFVFQ